tara:strand:- start:645 stop:1430 length:786 start_codon:yes stop_codon:yes gene_type:complete
MSFTGKSPSETYKDIVYVGGNNTGVDGTLQVLKTGDGSNTSLRISNTSLAIAPSSDSTTTLTVTDSGGNSKLLVDTTNDYVKANGVHVNTQYAHFGVLYNDSSSLVANTHYPISFGMGAQSTISDIDFGTGTDPDTSFTTANTDTQYASQIVPCMWYVPDNISIDSVVSIEGADAATGDTTRMHLYSFTFNSGSTSALADGTLLAHNSDVTNAGNEQAYKSTWTIDSASVAGGKVILAFFRSDSVNSDYSTNITVKYHITG